MILCMCVESSRGSLISKLKDIITPKNRKNKHYEYFGTHYDVNRTETTLNNYFIIVCSSITIQGFANTKISKVV